MNIFKVLFFLLLVPIFGLHAGGGDPYPRLTQEQNQAFQKSLQDQITNQENLVNAAINEMATPGELHTVANKIDIELAMTALQVKQTLYANFLDKDSLRSPLVRNTLLSVMQLPTISMSDLNHLQTVVNQEKQHIRDYDREQMNKQKEPPAQTPANTQQPNYVPQARR